VFMCRHSDIERRRRAWVGRPKNAPALPPFVAVGCRTADAP
jgi:hypothetical protein